MEANFSDTIHYIERGNFSRALDHAVEAQNLAVRLRDNDSAEEIGAHIRLIREVISGDELLKEGSYQAAIGIYTSALEYAGKVNDLGLGYIESGIATAEGYIRYYELIARADRLAEAGSYEGALSLYEEAGSVASGLPFDDGRKLAESGARDMEEQIAIAAQIAMALAADEFMSQADQHLRNNEFADAFIYYTSALELFIELEDSYNVSYTIEKIDLTEKFQADAEMEAQQPPEPGGGLQGGPPPAGGDGTGGGGIGGDGRGGLGVGGGGAGQGTTGGEETDMTESRYEHNRGIDFDMKTPIDSQNREPASLIRMGSVDGRNEGWYNGCGWVSAYNALVLLGSPRHPADIVEYFETSGGTVLGGVFGTYPNAIERFFVDCGYSVNHVVFPGRRLNIDNAIKGARVAVLAYTHTSAAHYAAIEYRESDGKFIVYNDGFARTRSAALGLQNAPGAGAVIDSVAAFIRETPEILFSFSLIMVS